MKLTKAYKDVFEKNGTLRINDGFKKDSHGIEYSLFNKNTWISLPKKEGDWGRRKWKWMRKKKKM
jgi:hypothetical protein